MYKFYLYFQEINRLMFQRFQIKHALTAPYKPSTNGQDERSNQTVKEILSKFVGTNMDDWDLHIPRALWSINSAPTAATKLSPFEVNVNE
jgi:transposase